MGMNIEQAIHVLTSLVEGLNSRVRNSVARGVIQTVVDSGNAQTVQIKIGVDEIVDKLPVLNLFGISSNPIPGSDCIAIFFFGNRNNGVVIATGHQTKRPKNMLPGETCIWDALGQQVYLGQTGMRITGTGDLPLTVTGFNKIVFLDEDTLMIEPGKVTINGIVFGTHKHISGAEGDPTEGPQNP